MTSDPPEYAQLDEGRHCNYWEMDPVLQFEARRVYPDEEFEWAEDVLRALDREDAHEALIPYVREKLDAVDHSLLANVASDATEAFRDLQNALGTLATEDEAYAQYHAKRLADLLFDVVTATLLLEEAQWQLENEDDARKALVARRFVATRFDDDEAYGVTSGDRFAMDDDVFASIVQHATAEPERLADVAAADD